MAETVPDVIEDDGVGLARVRPQGSAHLLKVHGKRLSRPKQDGCVHSRQIESLGDEFTRGQD